MNSNLKLFVWEGVLEDYTTGGVFILAESKEQALELLKEKDDTAHFCLTDPAHNDFKEPRVVEAPEAFVVWGGG